jgi:2-phospho-L-lactate/phosphoenolpyruvate guanylyltransferase
MSVWVIIPVKPLQLAKSRLSSVISPEQRQQFAESLLRHTLNVVTGVPQVAGTLVISRDPKALAIAREYRAQTVQESGAPELNSALMRATQVLMRWHCEAALVLPADLPCLEREDVSEIIHLGRESRSVVIATDEHHDGTNALFTRPPGLLTYAYGIGSFQRHTEQARALGAPVHVYTSPRIALDIDVPSDLDKYHQFVARSGQPQSLSFVPDSAHD